MVDGRLRVEEIQEDGVALSDQGRRFIAPRPRAGRSDLPARRPDRGRPGAQARSSPRADRGGQHGGPALGTRRGGWLVGFPLTSGPVAFFLALDQGVGFAAGGGRRLHDRRGRAGRVLSSLRKAGAPRPEDGRSWPAPSAFAAATAIFQCVALSLAWLVPIVIAALVVAPRLHAARILKPVRRRRCRAGTSRPGMMVTTALVLLLTGFATVLGPRLTGLLATFPLYGAILAGFAHHLQGPDPPYRVLRGLLLGLFAFAGFFLVLALSIERAGIACASPRPSRPRSSLRSGALWALRRGRRREPDRGGRGPTDHSRRPSGAGRMSIALSRPWRRFPKISGARERCFSLVPFVLALLIVDATPGAAQWPEVERWFDGSSPSRSAWSRPASASPASARGRPSRSRTRAPGLRPSGSSTPICGAPASRSTSSFDGRP